MPPPPPPPAEASSSSAAAAATAGSASGSTSAVPDTQLGLTSEEVQLLRQGQAALAAAGSSSSRAASRASSQGLLMLDSSSLASLGRYFDRVMAGLETQITRLSEQAQSFTAAQFDAAGELVDGADREMDRYRDILAQLDELEVDFDRIAHIKEIVRGYRARVEELDRELDREVGSGGGGGGASSRGHHHRHHNHMPSSPPPSSSSHKHSHKHGRPKK